MSVYAPLVAVTWQLLLVRSWRVHLDSCEPLVLALSVWLLYLGDHVLDSFRAPGTGPKPLRKVLFRQHRRFALVLGLLLAPSVLGLAVFGLGAITLEYGWILGLLVLTYFGLMHLRPRDVRSLWPREVLVSGLFTAGTFLPVWLGGRVGAPKLIACSCIFAVLCWGNCCVIESWEWHKAGSPPDTAPSATTQWISNHLTLFAVSCIVCALALQLASLLPPAFAGSAILTGIAFSLLDLNRTRISLHGLSTAMDCAMCTPMLYFVAVWLR